MLNILGAALFVLTFSIAASADVIEMEFSNPKEVATFLRGQHECLRQLQRHPMVMSATVTGAYISRLSAKQYIHEESRAEGAIDIKYSFLGNLIMNRFGLGGVRK